MVLVTTVQGKKGENVASNGMNYLYVGGVARVIFGW